MDHLLQQEPLIMAISAQEQLKMLFADMHLKLNIMFLEDLVGIAMVFQSNIKLIKL
jgi:hypothetical protein